MMHTNRSAIALALGGWLMLAAAFSAHAGLTVAIENDVPFSDNNYSHATQFGWKWYGGDGATVWQQVGIRQWFYTWDEITRTTELPSDHPYCGVETAFWQVLRREGNELALYELQVGVLGPSANGRGYQNTVHA